MSAPRHQCAATAGIDLQLLDDVLARCDQMRASSLETWRRSLAMALRVSDGACPTCFGYGKRHPEIGAYYCGCDEDRRCTDCGRPATPGHYECAFCYAAQQCIDL